MPIAPGLLLLCLVVAVAFFYWYRADKLLKEAQMGLSADELKTFNERYRRASRRADMPARFNTIAEASSRVARISMVSTVAITAALLWVVAAGPGLGLFPYP